MLSFGAIWLLWTSDKESIVEQTKAANQTGRYLSAWKGSRGVMICDPGRDDYMNVKAHHSIFLLSRM